MQIKFQTKEESNLEQLNNFLKLSKQERIYSFFKLIINSKNLPLKTKPIKKDNFFIEIRVNEKLAK